MEPHLNPFVVARDLRAWRTRRAQPRIFHLWMPRFASHAVRCIVLALRGVDL